MLATLIGQGYQVLQCSFKVLVYHAAFEDLYIIVKRKIVRVFGLEPENFESCLLVSRGRSTLFISERSNKELALC
jgi:hypothetical protein